MPLKKFIKNIDRIVEKKLKELKLKPKLRLSNFKKKDKRFYSSPCLTSDNQVVFFKILISREGQDSQLLKKEIAVTNFLAPFSQKHKRLNIPLFIKSNTEEYPCWFLRQYLPGRIIGHHFRIYKNGLRKEVREKAIDNLLTLQKITYKKYKDKFSDMGLKERKSSNYLQIIKKFENILKSRKKEKMVDVKGINQFFESQKKYLKKDNLVLAHGDATLANFFVSLGNVYLTDWELARIDNKAADIARTWIQTYKYRRWRKSLILYFLSKLTQKERQDFKEAFRLIIVVEALGELAGNVLTTSKENKFKKILKQTIKRAIKGFETLINI